MTDREMLEMAAKAKERPILFQGAMVRALLAGTKTQTRRVVKPQPPDECSIHYMLGDESWLPPEKRAPLHHHWEAWGGPLYQNRPEKHLCGTHTVNCPYGQPGDRLWVREKARCNYRGETPPKNVGSIGVEYGAGGSRMQPYTLERRDDYPWFPGRSHNIDGTMRWAPGIHMPRWASRILLEITGVRVERLQAISEADAVAEGLTFSAQARKSESCMGIYELRMPDGLTHFDASAVCLYRKLWEQINGPGSWDANPWVWVVEFRRLTRAAASIGESLSGHGEEAK